MQEQFKKTTNDFNEQNLMLTYQLRKEITTWLQISLEHYQLCVSANSGDNRDYQYS